MNNEEASVKEAAKIVASLRECVETNHHARQEAKAKQ